MNKREAKILAIYLAVSAIQGASDCGMVAENTRTNTESNKVQKQLDLLVDSLYKRRESLVEKYVAKHTEQPQ